MISKYEEFSPLDYNYIVSVDVGVKHLGLSLTCINKDFTLREVVWCAMIDITTFIHLNAEAEKKCTLFHDKTFTDYLEHVFYVHKELFDSANYILIERQPPVGYVVVEQLIFSKYRSKVVLISPNSVHKFFNWGGLDYESRKIYSVKVAKKYIFRDYMLDYFNALDRKHDVADSICMVVFWLHKKHKEWCIKEKKKTLERNIEYAKKNNCFHSHIYIEQFTFFPEE